MKCFKIIFPIFIGTLVYSILTFCVGPRGLWPMEQLEKQKIRISSNLDVLYTINQNLDSHLQNLSANPDTISVYAHELGYVAEGEQLIKLAGFSGGIDRKLVAGNTVFKEKPKFLSEWICKMLGLISGILVFFLFPMFFLENKHDNTKNGF